MALNPYARWVAASTIGFGVAGMFIWFRAPTAAVVGGLLGLENGPFVLLATQSELKEVIAWSMTLTGGVATGCVVGVLAAGCLCRILSGMDCWTDGHMA